ncbi:MAG: preprotein translocase subunit SecE [Oligoflexales bacterium]|nr:preprotein translocase subunit SecE [Oligoflexales bacterium]
MSKDDSTWLNIAYVAFALVVAYIGFRLITAFGVNFGWSERYDEWFPTFTNLGAILIGALAAFALRSDPLRREYHLASIAEIKKVSWPTLENTKKMTLIVAVVVCIFAVILSIFDVLWSKALQWILP